jgi:hypothetical protein
MIGPGFFRLACTGLQSPNIMCLLGRLFTVVANTTAGVIAWQLTSLARQVGVSKHARLPVRTHRLDVRTQREFVQLILV